MNKCIYCDGDGYTDGGTNSRVCHQCKGTGKYEKPISDKAKLGKYLVDRFDWLAQNCIFEIHVSIELYHIAEVMISKEFRLRLAKYHMANLMIHSMKMSDFDLRYSHDYENKKLSLKKEMEDIICTL